MNIFKILLGIIISTLGLGMAAAGWAIAIGGRWTPTINMLIGFVLVFFGLGIVWSGIMLMRDAAVRDALGGIITAQTGHGGINLRRGDACYSYKTSRIKRILYNILLYTFLAITIAIISILSVGKVIKLPL